MGVAAGIMRLTGDGNEQPSSALKANGETCTMVFDGALDCRIFETYIEKFLAPTLHPGEIVVMDNLNVHKSERARQ